jgi:hydroxymethylbilane synthase
MTLNLRVGTRGSALALTQTDHAIQNLIAAARQEGLEIEAEVVVIKTTGDASQSEPDASFQSVGPKGVFARELQRALTDDRIDVAVHSLKDLESSEPEGLVIAAVPVREDPRDVLVSPSGRSIAELDPGAVVGTSASRRQALVRMARPDLKLAPLRGNVDTRLQKIARGDVDAGILAAAGIVRLQREAEITEYLDPSMFVPAPGQGALAIEALVSRAAGDLAFVARADDADTRRCVETERAFMRLVESGCEAPLGAWARIEDGEIVCTAFVFTGESGVRATVRGTDPDAVARSLEAATHLT